MLNLTVFRMQEFPLLNVTLCVLLVNVYTIDSVRIWKMNFLKFVITFCFVSCTAASFIINSMPAAQRKEYENLVNQFQLEKKIMADSLSSASRIEFLKEMWKKESDAFGKVAVLPQGTEAQKKAQQKAAMEAIQKNLQDLKKVGAAYTNDNLSVLF
ncbi:hypothetical protein T01_10510 [Trichinella spiralis]|uniref:Uncharacterized protein n=1 Tax=Trichinella spiralis TaxID=6334 RepID=A0A0V1BJ45_TRISP|nr:hypothetical protein T01_10510 [Trichinella spiralis]